VTFNTWGMIDKNTGRHHDKFRFIFDKNSNPKPAYFALREAVVKPDEKLILK
jgi:GH35 family endo-1,4-beta-xylanase